MNWKYSSVGMRSIRYGLETTGRLRDVEAKLQEASRAALEAPHSSAWHDGSVVVDISLAIQSVLGDAAVEQVYYQAIKRSLGPWMEPFLKVMMALTGSKPEAVLARMNQSLKPIMQGVHTEWTQTSPDGGTLVVVHEDEVKPVSFFAWGGSLRYSFDLCGAKGTVTPKMPSPDNKRFTFELSWS